MKITFTRQELLEAGVSSQQVSENIASGITERPTDIQQPSPGATYRDLGGGYRAVSPRSFRPSQTDTTLGHGSQS